MAPATPDCAATVAALLTAGHAPADIEDAVVAELKRQTRGRWCRHVDGGWHDRRTCGQCETRAAMARIDSTNWQDPTAQPDMFAATGVQL